MSSAIERLSATSAAIAFHGRFERRYAGRFSAGWLASRSDKDLDALSEWLIDRFARLVDEREPFIGEGPEFWEKSLAVAAARVQSSQAIEERQRRVESRERWGL